MILLAACHGAMGDDPAVGPDASDTSTSDAAITPTTITVTLSEHSPTTTHLVAAFQDGDHAWQLAPAPVGDTYTFVVTSPTWRFAWACQAMLDYQLEKAVTFISFAVSERMSFVAPESCPRFLPVVKVAGTILNPPSTAASSFDVFFGELSGQYLSPQTNGTIKFEVSRLPGTHDLYATTSDADPGSRSVTKVAVARGVAANTNIANASVDFATAIATTPPVVITITGGASAETAASTTLYDTSGTQVLLTDSWAGPPHTSRGLAASQLQPGYVYEQKTRARTCVSTYCDEVEMQHWTTSIAARTVALPPALGTATTTAIGGSITMTWPAYPSAIGYRWFAVERAGDMEWSGIVGPSYTGSAPTFVIPDLRALPGWSDYVAAGSNEIAGQVTAVTSSLGSDDFPPAYPAPAGTERVLASSHLFLAGN